VNSFRGRSIQSAEHARKIPGPSAGGAVAQSLAQFFRALRAREQSFEQSSQVEPSPTHENRQMFSLFDFCKDLPRLTSVLAGCDGLGRRNVIQQVMLNLGSFRGGRFGGAKVEVAIHGDGIAIHDFAVKALRKRQGQSSLSAGRGAEHDHEHRLGLRPSCRQRTLQWMACQ